MFTCQQCAQPTGPGISPTKVVVSQRPKVYLNEAQEPLGVGSEIEKEHSLCPACSGTKVPTQPVIDRKLYQSKAHLYQAHVKKCNGTEPIYQHGKKVGSTECRTCKRFTEDWSNFPPAVLSEILEEPTPPANHPYLKATSLANRAVDKMLDRSVQSSKRAQRDAQATGTVLQSFLKQTGVL